MTEIDEILLEFQAHGITSSAIERVLGLGQGSIIIANLIQDPETLALLRMIKTFPWLLTVAEHNFDEHESKRILLHHAVDLKINEQINKERKEVESNSRTDSRVG